MSKQESEQKSAQQPQSQANTTGSAAKVIQDSVKRFEDRAQWTKCPECGVEYSGLVQAGKTQICPDCVRQRQRLADKDSYLKAMIGPSAYRGYDWRTYKATPGVEDALRVCQGFDPGRDNLFLFGPCGVGKTHLAVAALKSAYWAGHSVRFATPQAISRDFRKLSADQEEALLAAYAEPEVLLIDDLGVEKSTEHLLSVFYEIINRRMSWERNGLIVTSNLGLGELSRKFGDDRLSSRLAGFCTVVEMMAVDYRIQEAV